MDIGTPLINLPLLLMTILFALSKNKFNMEIKVLSSLRTRHYLVWYNLCEIVRPHNRRQKGVRCYIDFFFPVYKVN